MYTLINFACTTRVVSCVQERLPLSSARDSGHLIYSTKRNEPPQTTCLDMRHQAPGTRHQVAARPHLTCHSPWRSLAVAHDNHGVSVGVGQVYAVQTCCRKASEGHQSCGPRQEATLDAQFCPLSQKGSVVAHYHHHHTPRGASHL